jgi:hypothetical protein
MNHYLPNMYHTPKWQAPIVDPAKQFHFHDGPAVATMFALKNALTQVPQDTLTYHVTGSQHDLADWIEYVVEDSELAATLRQYTNRWGMIVALERQMMRTLNLPPFIARRWLGPAYSKMQFISGDSVGSLHELADTLERISDDAVDHHLKPVPNDVANWVAAGVGNYPLSEQLEDASNRLHLHQFLTDHLAMLTEASRQ